MKIKEINQFVENLDSSEAHYMYGYLKGYHNIKDADK